MSTVLANIELALTHLSRGLKKVKTQKVICIFSLPTVFIMKLLYALLCFFAHIVWIKFGCMENKALYLPVKSAHNTITTKLKFLNKICYGPYWANND